MRISEFACSPSEARFLIRVSATNWRFHSKNGVFFVRRIFFPVLILKTPLTTFAGGRGPRRAENVKFILVLCVFFSDARAAKNAVRDHVQDTRARGKT